VRSWRTSLAISRPVLLGIAGTLGFLALWEATARSGFVAETMFPSVTKVAYTAAQLFVSGELITHISVSLQRALFGFGIGSFVGVVLGVATARIASFRQLTEPIIQMFRAIPSIAFVPVAIFWFGLGETSKLFLIAWGVFFPVWVNTFLGVRDVNPLVVRAAESLGASGPRLLYHVVLPAAMPFVLAGLRISLSVGFVCLVAAEISGAVYGVGYLIQLSQMVYRIDQMFVGLIFLGLLGFLADRVFVVVVRKLFPWYGAEERANQAR
jgi:ABC-type nitrate/sulfonate/bicarbonate transport system permease component